MTTSNNKTLYTLVLIAVGIFVFTVTVEPVRAQSYCSCSSVDSSMEWVRGVSFNTINQTSGSSRYSDYTGVSTNVYTGDTHNLQVTIGQLGGWSEYVRAAFDWNLDDDFDDSGETFDLGSCLFDGCSVDQDITIPASAAGGMTRMRIIQSYLNYAGPCGFYTYGETEDYTVVIQDQAPVCSGLTATPSAGEPPLLVNFTASASDPNGSVVRYEWDFDGDGIWDDSTGGNTNSHPYSSEGIYTARARARDNDGNWSAPCEQTVTVSQAAAANIYGWAWFENIGWTSFNSDNCDPDEDGFSEGDPGCPASGTTVPPYGVDIVRYDPPDHQRGYLEGYAWSENVGWFTFNRNEAGSPPTDDVCPAGGCLAEVDLWCSSDQCAVEGWARACAVFQGGTCQNAPALDSNRGGWDGWVHLSDSQYQVYVNVAEPSINYPRGDFFDWAWSASDELGSNWEEVGIFGWQSFNNVNCDPGEDGTCDGLFGCPGGACPVDYEVYTTFPDLQSPTDVLAECRDSYGPMRITWVDQEDTESEYQVRRKSGEPFSDWEESSGMIHITPTPGFPIPGTGGSGLAEDHDVAWDVHDNHFLYGVRACGDSPANAACIVGSDLDDPGAQSAVVTCPTPTPQPWFNTLDGEAYAGGNIHTVVPKTNLGYQYLVENSEGTCNSGGGGILMSGGTVNIGTGPALTPTPVPPPNCDFAEDRHGSQRGWVGENYQYNFPETMSSYTNLRDKYGPFDGTCDDLVALPGIAEGPDGRRVCETTAGLTIGTGPGKTGLPAAGISAIIFVNGDLVIEEDFSSPPDWKNGDNPIDFRDDFAPMLVFVVENNLDIYADVQSIYGIYIVAGNTYTNTLYPQPPAPSPTPIPPPQKVNYDDPLHIFGSLLCLGDIDFVRRLGDYNHYPAERVIFMPRYYFELIELVGEKTVSWREVRE